MAEDEGGEPGLEAGGKSLSEDEPVTLKADDKEEAPKVVEIEQAPIEEKTEKIVDETSEFSEAVPAPIEKLTEDDEGSQSIKLVFEDNEDKNEPKTEEIDKIVENVSETENKEEETVKSDEKDCKTKDDEKDSEKKEDAGTLEIDGKKEEAAKDKESPPEKISISEVEGEHEDNKTEDEDNRLIIAEDNSETTKDELESQEKDGIVGDSELGIVGEPRVASELLSEAELIGTEKPTLPTDETKVADRVVRWVEKTARKADDPEEPEDDDDDDDDDVEEELDEEGEEEEENCNRRVGPRKRKQSNGTNGTTNRKSQKVVSNIIRRSIRCLNKMHAMESSGGGGGNGSSGNGKKVVESSVGGEAKREPDDACKSPKVPQSQQNGAALPEETASSDRNFVHCPTAPGSPSKKEKKETAAHAESNDQRESQENLSKSTKLQSEQTTTTTTSSGKQSRGSGNQRGNAAKLQQSHQQQDELRELSNRESRKRRSVDAGSSALAHATNLSSNGNSMPKKICLDQREQFINSIIGLSDKFTADQLTARAEQLRAEVMDLDELARAKEAEWNEILSMRKLKEEAYLRLERRRQIMGFMDSNGPLGADNLLPPASLALLQQNYDVIANPMLHSKDKLLIVPKEERAGSVSRDTSPTMKRERSSKLQSSYQLAAKHQMFSENGPKQIVDAQNPELRQIGEGRQGPIVDVKSIIADYRLRHPETVPRRRGRRMRNSVNVNLGAGGAMVETVGNMDSRPSSTDSCKSNSNVNDPNNATVSFKDVLVQFAKLSQQQGEPIKTPQNYPDVTLHPVAATAPSQNSAPQASGSLLHGILTKSQSPRPTTFSPTLARLLTAPERERSSPTIAPASHQTATQHLLQAYQSANPVSISDFLSSSKARTEITITPVVSNPAQTHSNNSVHIDDVEEETSIIEERDSRLTMGSRDNRDDRDSPPRCQGCHERAAQFVCAGCGNQWYCSRECQVAAWDDHSEVCSG